MCQLCCRVPGGGIVGRGGGFLVGMTRLGLITKHTTYGFGEKV